MLLAEARAALRRNLAGAIAVWSEEILDGGVARAAADLDRLYPQEGMHGYRVVINVADEAWTSAYDTAVQLANTRIKPNSETVTTVGGATTYTRNTDYTMNYVYGTVTALSTGAMADTTGYEIDYKVLEVYVDLSDIADLIRVARVEYPGGQIPAEFQSFYTWGDFLVITSDGTSTQAALRENEHVWVYYHSKHTLPLVAARGSWSPQLDEVVIKGAEGYCLFTKALEIRHSARDRQADSLAALDEIAAISGEVDTALTDMRTQASSASADMGNIDAYIANMIAALAGVATYLAKAEDAVASAVEQADQASVDISVIDTPLASATERLVDANGLVATSDTIVELARSVSAGVNTYISSAWTVVEGITPLIAASTDALAESTDYLNQAESRLLLAQAPLDLAEDVHGLHIDNLMDILNSVEADPITLVGESVTAAGNQLLEAIAVTNQVNIGEAVSEMRRRYAADWTNIARLRYDEYRTFLEKIDRRVAQSGAMLAEAGERRSQADSMINGALAQQGGVQQLLSRVQAYQDNVVQRVNIIQSLLGLGQALNNTASASVGNSARAIEQANSYVAIARLRLDAARESSELADAYGSAATRYVEMAQAKISEAQSYETPISAVLQRVAQKVELSRVYQSESDRRIQEIAHKLGEADRYISLSNQESMLADKMDETATRINRDFMAILVDRAQVRSDTALVPTRQQA